MLAGDSKEVVEPSASTPASAHELTKIQTDDSHIHHSGKAEIHWLMFAFLTKFFALGAGASGGGPAAVPILFSKISREYSSSVGFACAIYFGKLRRVVASGY